MSWRYQLVYRDSLRERCYSLCEVYLDDQGTLRTWTESCEMHAQGETPAEFRSDLFRMYIDSWRWKAVAFDALIVGMIFDRAATREECDSLAVLLDRAGAKTDPEDSRDETGR